MGLPQLPRSPSGTILGKGARRAAATLLALGAACTAPAAVVPAGTGAPRAAPAQSTPSCAVDLAAAEEQLRVNYAGYDDKVQGREAHLAALSDSLHSETEGADWEKCTNLIWALRTFFDDRHIGLSMERPPQWQAAAAASEAPRAEADPRRPSVEPLDARTAYLRVPSFRPPYRAPLDSLLQTHRAGLLARPRLILDLRGNSGGLDATFSGLVSLLYTGPIRVTGNDVLASPENAALFRAQMDAEGVSAFMRGFLRDVIARMEARPGELVPFSNGGTITRDTVHSLPSEVVVLVDRGVASSAEEFVLQARQSDKVTLMGENTSGTLDYSNVVPRPLPSRWPAIGRIVLHVPTTRSHRVKEGSPVDVAGIAPDVRIPEGVGDWVAFAAAWLDRRVEDR